MTYREYTWPEIRRIAADWAKGRNVAVIAADHNRSIYSLYSMMAIHRDLFPRRPKTPGIRQFDRDEAADLRSKGLSFAEVGRRLGVTARAVQLALKGGPPYFDARRKLDETAVLQLRSEGKTLREIAENFRVSHTAVQKALRRAA